MTSLSFLESEVYEIKRYNAVYCIAIAEKGSLNAEW